MISKKIIINLDKKDDIFHLEPLSDIHVGHMGFNKELYQKRVRSIIFRRSIWCNYYIR